MERACEICGREDRPLTEAVTEPGTYRCDRHPEDDGAVLDLLAELAGRWHATPSAFSTLVKALEATGRRVER